MFYPILIFTLLFLLFPILFCFQDYYLFIPISKWIKYLFHDSIFEFSNWLDLYFAVLIGLIGVYFTIVSILLNNKNITPFTCLKHTLFVEDYLLILAISANTLLALFCFPYIRFTNAVLLYFIFGILFIILFFIKCTYSLIYTDRESKAARLLSKRILLNIKHNKNLAGKGSFNFAYNFIFKCFQNKKFEIMEESYKFLKENNKKQIEEIEHCFCTIITELEDKQLVHDEPQSLRSYISFITSRLYFLIYNSTDDFDKRYELISSYYKKLLSIYKAYLYEELVNESYLLLLSEPITYLYKFNLPVENKVKLMNIFSSLLKECRDLIIISLYHCNFETLRNEIHHYMNFVQFLSLTDEYEELLRNHDKYLIDICTRILNVVQLDIVPKKYLVLIEPLLKQARRIDITPIEYEMYDELLPEIGIHEVKYSRTFYITVMWFWYYCTKKDLYLIFNKFEYDDNKNNEKVWAYKVINDSLSKMDYTDITNLLSDLNETKFEENKNLLSVTLFTEEKKENERFVENLKQTNYTEELKKELEIKKNDFIKEFSFMKLNRKSRKIEKVSVEGLTFIFSIAKLNGYPGYQMFGMTFYSILKDFLFAKYLRNAEIIDISALSGIKDLEEQTQIMLSHSYNKYFFERKDLNYFGGDLNINGKIFKLEFINTASNLIILRKDFNAAYGLENVETQEEDKHAEEKTNVRDVFVEIPFKPIFRLTKNKHVAYRLLMN